MSLVENERIDPEGDNSAIPQVTNDPSTNSNETTDLEKSTDFLHQFNLNCPFTWKPESHLKFNLEDILNDYSDTDELFDQNGFRIRRFVVNLLHCYVNFFKRLVTKSLENLEEMEAILSNSKRQDVYFTTINEALVHIMLSCKVYLLHESNRNEKAMELIQNIKPIEEMDESNRAGIWGIRANLYAELGYNGLHGAVLYLERAISIDGKNAYWYFLKGVYKGRIRRIESVLAIPSIDEIQCLEVAMKLKQDAAFYAFAGEAYSETATRSSKCLKEKFYGSDEWSMTTIKNYTNKMNEKAREYFCECINLNPVCSHLLFRSGKGLLKLQPPYQDYKRGLEYLKRGLAICPTSNYGNHAMAKYYEKVEKNYELAKKYLKVSVEKKNFGASLDLLRIEFFQTKDADALLKGFLKLFDLYSDKVRHCKILAEIISFHLFLDYNISECINYMNKLLYLIDDNHQLIKKHFSGILPLRRPISLLDVLLADILFRSKENSLSAEEKDLCENFLKKLCYDNVELPKLNQENVRGKIKNEIERNLDDVNLNDIKHSLAKTSQNYNPAQCKKQEFMNNYEEDEPHQENIMKHYKVEKKDVESKLQMRDNSLEARSSKVNDMHDLAEQFSKIYASRNRNDDLHEDILNREKKLKRTENHEVTEETARGKHDRHENDYNEGDRSNKSRSVETLKLRREFCVKKNELENDNYDRHYGRKRSTSRETYRSKKEESRYEDNKKYIDSNDRHHRRRRSRSREIRTSRREYTSNDRFKQSDDEYDRRYYRQRSNNEKLRRTSSNSSYEVFDDDYNRRHHRRSENRKTHKSEREASNDRSECSDHDVDLRHRSRRNREKSTDRNYRLHRDIEKRPESRESYRSRNKSERRDDRYRRRSYEQRFSSDDENCRQDKYYYSEDEDSSYHYKK